MKSRYDESDIRLTKEAFAARLNDLIGKRSPQSVAEAAGLSANTLRNALQSKYEMSRDKVISLARELNTTVEYLATGQNAFQPGASEGADPDMITMAVLSYHELLHDISLQLELGSVGQAIPSTRAMNRVKLTLTKALFEENHVQPSNVRLVMCQGDAMEPTFRNGDFCLVDVTVGQPVLEGVYLLLVSNSMTLRRMAATPQGLTAIPDNAKYQPFKVSLDAQGRIDQEGVQAIGRVFWVLRGLTP